jgi:large subunit ribosomal protein L23
MKLNNNQIIIRPVLTEKTNLQRERLSKFAFKVHKNANKIMIKKALEELYDVEVKKINILNSKSKQMRFRYQSGRKAGYKKAIVTLTKGTFDIFEGV